VIRLEPRAIYDAAIINQDGDRLVYCYDRLIDVLVKSIQEHQDISSDDAYYQAVDHISFNIEGMAINYKDWPIIKREGDEQSKEEQKH
tara:strand:+ start:486 stop:749 length:264 start_codon:yes stop_codon:yes gene_type:complete